MNYEDILRAAQNRYHITIKPSSTEKKRIMSAKSFHTLKKRRLGGKKRDTYCEGKYFQWYVENLGSQTLLELVQENLRLKMKVRSLAIKLAASEKRIEDVKARSECGGRRGPEPATPTGSQAETLTKSLRRVRHVRIWS